jgi:Zn-dependent metalloprotease
MLTCVPQMITAVGSDLLEVKNIAALSRREVNEIGALLVGKYFALLKVRPDQLVLKKAEKTDGSWYVSYQQTVHGIGVYGSSLEFSIDPEGRIKSIGALLYPEAQAPAAPRIHRGQAMKIALGRLQDPDKSGYQVLAEGLAIYPVRKTASVDYHRVHIFNLFPKKAAYPASAADGWAVFVDTQTGEVVHHQAVPKSTTAASRGNGLH